MRNTKALLKKVRVLLVDDEQDFTSTLSKRLGRRGMSVLTANDGFEAYSLLEESPVDVVVMDMQMPGPDGMQTLKSIKKRFHGVEVILLTGQGSMRDAIHSATAGAFDFLFKPTDVDELTGRIMHAARA